MTEMIRVTRKERMRRALRHEPVDRIPTQVSLSQAMGQRLAAHLGLAPERLPQRLDNHLLRLDLTHEDKRSSNGRIAFELMTDAPLKKVEAMLASLAAIPAEKWDR